MSEDPYVGRALDIGGVAYTIIGIASWGNYYYLVSQRDDEEPIIRPMGVIRRAFELGVEMDPNA